MPYDRDSGQVFKETVLSRNALAPRDAGEDDDGGDWSQRMLRPLVKPRSIHGPRSLVSMSIHVVADNINQVTEQHLLALPPELMWRAGCYTRELSKLTNVELTSKRGISLQAWRLFSNIAKRNDELTMALYRFRHHICRPGGELRRYTQPLTSLSAEFITHLVISGNCAFDTRELLCLTEIKNLGVLEIIQPTDTIRDVVSPEVTDRLVRGWTEADDPFPLLRVLRIWGRDTTTRESLQWVSRLPSLAMYDVVGTREDWKNSASYAMEHGWTSADPGTSTDDSLLRDLLQLIPNEASRPQNVRTLARSIESDLVSICANSQCAVKPVAHGKAPALHAYLTDAGLAAQQPTWNGGLGSTPADRLSCRGHVYEPWAFWLYSFAGQLGEDRDLKNRGLDVDNQTVVGPFVLPSRPFASMFLGHNGHGIIKRPAYVMKGLFSTARLTFTRPNLLRGDAPTAAKTAAAAMHERSQGASGRRNTTPSFRPQKRVRLGDILDSFSA